MVINHFKSGACKKLFICSVVLCACFTGIRADEVDNIIKDRMRENNITGLSLAIIQDGKIEPRCYGFTDNSHQTPVTPTTLFQAGSISKSVAAVGALRLVQVGKLSLDADVNTQLRSWKVPENDFTKDKKVTLRGILSHSAGLTVHGFGGYARNRRVPTLVEVLNGTSPANSSPIRVDVVPGTLWRYSGGGYVVMQQMILDVTQEPFPKFMSDTVLEPLGMANSTDEQPLPRTMSAAAAAGYYANGHEVAGRWHVYPEMAPAGLWTTPSDLARFAIGVQDAYKGISNPVLSQETVRQMLTVQNPSLSKEDGLGVFVAGSGKTFRFSHNGRNAGFDSLMIELPNAGKGAVIMIDANDDKGALDNIMGVIAKEYDWYGENEAKVDPAVYDSLAGQYDYGNGAVLTVTREGDGLYAQLTGQPKFEIFPGSETNYFWTVVDAQVTFVKDSTGKVTKAIHHQNGQTFDAPRIR